MLSGTWRGLTPTVALRLLAFCAVCLVPGPAAGNGRLSVQLLEYRSVRSGSGGEGSRVGGIRFQVSISRSDGSDRKHPLFSYRQTTHNYTDSDVINFGKHIGILQNPFFVDFNFTDNEGHGVIEVAVVESTPANSTGDTRETQLAQFEGNLMTSASASATGKAQVARANLTTADKHRSLQVSHWFVCLPGSYGRLCNRQCQAQDSDTAGHYTCDPASGDKLCRPGWSNPQSDCKQQNQEDVQQNKRLQHEQELKQPKQKNQTQQPQQKQQQQQQHEHKQEQEQEQQVKNSSSVADQGNASSIRSNNKTLVIVLVSLSLCVLLIAAVGGLSVVMSDDSNSTEARKDSKPRSRRHR